MADDMRFEVAALAEAVAALFRGAGLDEDKAAAVAETLVEADMMGRRTHGLALAPFYLDAATSGAMTVSGEPDVVADRAACVTWRGAKAPRTVADAKGRRSRDRARP